MGKNKPRHNPDKPQNKYSNWCQYAEEHNSKIFCECGYGDASICKGNRHNCVKAAYKKLACRSDTQKNESQHKR